jgi:hypothetical protein
MVGKETVNFAPEYILRIMWKSQELKSRSLQTDKNQPLQIISPGVANTDSGPDFQNACRLGPCKGNCH